MKIVVISAVAGTFLALSGLAQAGPPVITKYDAHLLEKEVRLNISWQSDEPVTKIIASADKEQVVVTAEIDNDRNDAGYSGTMDLVVPFNPENLYSGRSFYMNQQTSTPTQERSTEIAQNSVTPYQYAISYAIQLVDEVNQRSAMVKDTIRRFEETRTARGGNLSQSQDQKTTTSGGVTVDVGKLSNAAAQVAQNVLEQISAKPWVKELVVKRYADNRTAFAVSAQDDKGVAGIVIEVRNPQGQIVHEESVECADQKECTKTSNPISLGNGMYKVSVVALDGDGRKSAEKVKEFGVEVAQTAPSADKSSPKTTSDSDPPDDGTEHKSSTGG
ncbi:hypothetical protein LPW11_05850 [Geomonas sp. RF6]|uniref:hypothetical protein n=1 Tax=Geomonas sp. RF6 TaxID=2897342 RepID=UPI001E561FD3|nr:hypothetical protein [Geomonas sp. RF6]UFS71714.1 hypothetical protein LPW11_05850 [Geomonas sp. RF6]